MRDDLEGMATFVAVADTRGFRAAADRLGVAGSAVSQAIRRLEERLGVALVHRTTRSVRLTAAGERLYAGASNAIAELRSAVLDATELDSTPHGTLRLHIAGAAQSFLHAEFLADFIAKQPRVALELHFSDEPLDIVAEGFDAGVRLGEVIDRDMVAVPVSGDLRLLVVGAPSYFARRPKPKHPRELVEHACINWRPTVQSPPYRWEFTEQGREFSVDVRASVVTNDPSLNLRLAAAGAGITLADESRSRESLARGELVTALEDFSTPFPGYYLYYPERRRTSAALRALIDHLKNAQRPALGAKVAGKRSRTLVRGRGRQKR